MAEPPADSPHDSPPPLHAFSEPDVGYPSSRYLHVARARVDGGRLVIDAEA